MDETDKSEESDAFTENGRNNPQLKNKSQSYINLRNTNRCLIIALITLALLLIAAIIAIIVIALIPSSEETSDESKDATVCHTEDCLKTAKYLYENMDLSVDPCDDFYNYTCRGWGINHPRPPHEIMWGVNTLVSKDLNEKIRAILQFKESKVESSAIHKARNFYIACTNFEFREEYGREQLFKVIKKIGGVPLINSGWSDVNYDWEKAYVYCDLTLNSMQTFFEYKIEREDPKDLRNAIDLKMPEAFYIAPKLEWYDDEADVKNIRNQFKETVVKVVKDLGSDLSSTQIDKDVQDLIDFERKLYSLSKKSSRTDRKDEYFTVSLQQLDKNTPGMNCTKIFSLIFTYVNITLPLTERVYVRNPTYFGSLGELLRETSKRTLANYIGYSVILGFGGKIIPHFNADEKIDEEKQKTKCTELTEKFFRVALNYWFVKQYFGRKMMTEVNEFLKEIKNALTLTIQTNKWMDDDTKLEAQRKLNSMIEFIATSTQIKNDSDLDIFYQHTGFISSENFPHDYKKMSKWFKRDELTKLREIGDKKVNKPSVVNAYYSLAENKIRILTGFLTPPNFYPGAPVSVNIAAVGSTIGHEITHGFDNTGSQFDYKGYMKNWWGEKTLEKYKDKVNCFIDQYSQFVEPKSGLKVNGRITVGENIADNGAIHQAFTAYKMYSSLKYPEKDLKLPLGMSKFTKDQLFFIGYANTYCNDHSKRLAALTASDAHPPDVSRVIIPLQNSPEFAKAFNCKLGSRMNPEDKCILW